MKESIQNAVKQNVLTVLNRHAEMQPNLASSSCRNNIANSIVEEVAKHFTVTVKPFLPLDITVDLDVEYEFGK